MLVRITPPGRATRVFDVPGVQRSWDINGGCAAATVPVVLTAEDRERILLARVETHDWSGFVWRQPIEGKPLECAGQAIALTMQRGKALYAKTNFLRDMEDFNGQNWGIFSRSDTGGVLTIVQNPGTTSGTSDGGGYIYHSDELLVKLVLTAQSNSANFALMVQGADINGTLHGSATSWTAGTYAAQTVTFPAATYGFYIWGSTGAANTATASEFWVAAHTMTLYGVSFAVTPYNVIDDVLDKLPAWALTTGDAYRRWVGSPTLTITSLDFEDSKTTLKDRIDAVVPMTDYHFGFYPEWVNGLRVGVPHFSAIETTPTLSLDVGSGLTGTSVDTLGSDFIVSHPDDEGRPTQVSVADADATHYLNVIGYDRDVPLDAPWTTSDTLATAVGTQAAALSDVRGAEGQADVKRVRLVNGRRAPLSIIRPGRLAYVYVDGIRRELLITGCQATDNSAMRVTFGKSPTTLRALTAKATGRGNY
ncbi:MAG: hypothetical protein WC415_06315 [Patescibacteria group bacterium]|jgi:hypothetical protein